MSPANVIDMLTEDHRQVSAMFQQYEKLPPGERDQLVHEIIQSLRIHASLEDQVLYPFIRAEVTDGDQLMDEAEREHQEAEDTMDRLAGLTPDDPAFDEAFRALRDSVEHHVEEEEGEVFPKLSEAADASTLGELGQRLAQARSVRPREAGPG